ncbi:hypothetical protein AB0I81_43640 [Nonomuraea sp. NPDC050404]|uniref:hypothetical protein n=1 Tax=Nonomuraea sp. NPDC050404 TaxID=3155783 RepID=UPI0033C19406
MLLTTSAFLLDQLRALPDEAFTRAQYFTPAAGCHNVCAFCSQQAGRDVWQLTERGLTSFAHAYAQVAAERGLTIAGGRIHRPGVLFPYLDNDIASYPHLDTMCGLARDVLGVRLRVSTVGYSSLNPHLVAMHQRIAEQYGDVFDGIRLSLTPYTAGWIGRDPATSRAQFVRDFAHTLVTYRPVFDQLGHGSATAAVEMRFAPLLGTAELTDTVIDGRHVLACGPHLLISLHEHDGELPLTEVERLDERTQPVFSTPGRRYLHLVCDRLSTDPATVLTVLTVLTGQVTAPHRSRTVRVFRFANADGDYFAADPDFHPDGTFTALHLYPATGTRLRSGYTDATRHVLNTLLAYKAARGLGRRDPFPHATPADVAAVLNRLDTAAAQFGQGVDRRAATHLADTVIPLLRSYAEALDLAGYPAEVFFSRDFTVDTGQIVNQGRALGLFRGLVSLDGEPMTPREERGFGAASLSSVRGPIWRIAPIPFAPGGHLPPAVTGGKNSTTDRPTLVIEELDPCHLRPVMRGTCTRLRRYTVTGVELEHLTLDQGHANLAMPGLLAAA